MRVRVDFPDTGRPGYESVRVRVDLILVKMWRFHFQKKCRRVTSGFALGDFVPILTLVIQVTYDWLTGVCLLLKSGIWMLFSYHENCQKIIYNHERYFTFWSQLCQLWVNRHSSLCILFTNTNFIEQYYANLICTFVFKFSVLPHIMAMHRHYKLPKKFFSQLFSLQVFAENYLIYDVKTFLVWFGLFA